MQKHSFTNNNNCTCSWAHRSRPVGMITSFFFGWKAAILSAISSRAVNLPRREITKLGVVNEEQKKWTINEQRNHLRIESAISFFCFRSWPLFSCEWFKAKCCCSTKDQNTLGGEDLPNFESSSRSKTLLFRDPGSASPEDEYILNVGDFSLAATCGNNYLQHFWRETLVRRMWSVDIDFFLDRKIEMLQKRKERLKMSRIPVYTNYQWVDSMSQATSPVFEEKNPSDPHFPNSWSACSFPALLSPSHCCFLFSPFSFSFSPHSPPMVFFQQCCFAPSPPFLFPPPRKLAPPMATWKRIPCFSKLL